MGATYADSVGIGWGDEQCKSAETSVSQNMAAAENKPDAQDVGKDGIGGDKISNGSRNSKMLLGDNEKKIRNSAKKSDGDGRSCSKSPHSNGEGSNGDDDDIPRPEPATGNSTPLPNVHTVTITAEDVTSSSSVISIVDPWVPRIRNNDEYLQRGLDFSPKDGAKQNGDNNSKSNNDGVVAPPILIGDVGATRLAEALSTNTRLLYLNLSRNDIGVEGGVALAKCLYSSGKSKTVLRDVKLSHNRICNEGAMAFGQALRYNTSVMELKLTNCEITLDGVLALMEGLDQNEKLKRLVLVDNIKNLSGVEMRTLVTSVGRVLRSEKSSLEVLEMHSSTLPVMAMNNFDRLSRYNLLYLKCSMYGVDGTSLNSADRLTNHRLRTLTLPGNDPPSLPGRGDSAIGKLNVQPIHELRKILQFNNLYRPILQLRDILNSPLALAEASLSLPVKLPPHLQRDVHSGALVGLLPPVSFNSPPRRLLPQATQSSVGMDYKLMPRVLSFVCGEGSLDTIWNVIRYRPDIFCCAGTGMIVKCAPCSSLGGAGCCIS